VARSGVRQRRRVCARKFSRPWDTRSGSSPSRRCCGRTCFVTVSC
jgi:hypothetical protein